MAICPRCGEDYPKTLTACPACDTAPVSMDYAREGGEGVAASDAADAPDPTGSWVQAAETGQLYEAEFMAGRLRNAGVEAQVVDQTFHQEPLTNVRNFAVVRVMVKASDHARATELLAQNTTLPDDADVGTAAPGDEDKSR